MLVILGETAAAREINNEFKSIMVDAVRIVAKKSKATLLNGDGKFVEQLNFMLLPEWLAKISCTGIVDASHPSGSNYGPLHQWCEKTGTPYLRLERPETKVPENALIHPVQSWEEAMLVLEKLIQEKKETGRNPVTVFVTTGSHQLENLAHKFAKSSRLVVRVLPEARLIQKCQDLGIPPKDIVAMQGPFSKELNRILFKSYGADILLTRDSGHAGGTDTKISAAMALSLQCVLIKRPVSTKALKECQVHSIKEVITWVKKYCKVDGTL